MSLVAVFAACFIALLVFDADAGTCTALTYKGKTGGAKIQNAINDLRCQTIIVDPVGPDGGMWYLETPLILRSNLMVRSTTETQLPVLLATGANWGNYTAMILITGQSDVTLHRINLQGDHKPYNGIAIRQGTRILIESSVIARTAYHGVYVGDGSSDVQVTWTLIEDNALTSVRADTSDDTFLARVSVRDSWLNISNYGVSFANCGGATLTCCDAQRNTIRPRAGGNGSGIDLNRAHYALVSGNIIQDAWIGITVDDTTSAQIESNDIERAALYGIVLANGALPAHKPWWVSYNTVTRNTVANTGSIALVNAKNPSDPDDHNVGNTWTSNTISGSGITGCYSNGDQATFTGNGPEACPP